MAKKKATDYGGRWKPLRTLVHGRVRGRRTARKRTWLAALVCATSILTIVSGALGSGDQRQGGILRIAIADLDYVDPALS